MGMTFVKVVTDNYMKNSMKTKILETILEEVMNMEVRRGNLSFEIDWHQRHSDDVPKDVAQGFINGLKHAQDIIDGKFENLQWKKNNYEE